MNHINFYNTFFIIIYYIPLYSIDTVWCYEANFDLVLYIFITKTHTVTHSLNDAVVCLTCLLAKVVKKSIHGNVLCFLISIKP